jgi:hypothetical protein
MVKFQIKVKENISLKFKVAPPEQNVRRIILLQIGYTSGVRIYCEFV